MKRIFACLISMGMILSVSSRGTADSHAPDFDQTGVYVAVGGSVGITTQIEDELEDEFKKIEGDLPLGLSCCGVDQDKINGYKIRVGWRYHAAAAIEAEFERGTPTDLSLEGVDVIESDSWTAMINFKFFPIGGRFQPYALFGAGALRVKWEDEQGVGISGEDNDAAMRFGGGLDVYIAESLFLFLDANYVLPTGDVRNFDYVSLGAGLGYRW